MSLIDEVNSHNFVGMPFHAISFPSPLNTYLSVSDDGVNWQNLKKYDFGWRDVSMAYINGEFWTCSGSDVHYTTDFETFNHVGYWYKGLANLWASEFYQDPNKQWWFVYCGSETNVDYSEFKFYVSRFYPEKHEIDLNRQQIIINDDIGGIDPNINYINGKYYMWISVTSTPTQELRLYESDNLTGPYNKVNTNIVSLTNDIGFTWNEAPEMIVDNGKYYLYSDPWNKGMNESQRNIYVCESTNLKTWNNMQPLKDNDGITYRHFTPLFKKAKTSGSSNINNISLNTWSGDPSTFYSTNLGNFKIIKDFIDNWNNASGANDYLTPISIELDTTDYTGTNRNAYNQFLENAKKINSFLGSYIDMYRLTDFDYIYSDVSIPANTEFNRIKINEYWTTLNNHFNFLINQVNSFK